MMKKRSTQFPQPFQNALRVAVGLCACTIIALISWPSYAQTAGPLAASAVTTTASTNPADFNQDGNVNGWDLSLLLSYWGKTTPTSTPTITPTPTRTPTVPTFTPTHTPAYVVNGFWVSDPNFIEYFSDPTNHPVHRTGQFLWHLKLQGNTVTGTGDDMQYPVTINATFNDGILEGTLKSFGTFNMYAVQNAPSSATGSAQFEGWYWGSKDGFNYDGSFTVKKSDVRPTLAPTATPTPIPQTPTPTFRTPIDTPTRTFTPTPTL